MNEREYTFLKSLSEAFGPSGEEDAVRDLIFQEIRPYADQIRIDSMGNLVAIKGKADFLLICAHMDEVGFMITQIREDGMLRFSPIGGVDPKYLSSKRVRIGTNRIPGVISAIPVHLNKEKNGKSSYSNLLIDIGARTKQEAESHISIGDCAVFDTKFSYLDPTHYTLKGKALDNRIGCFLLCKLIADPEIQNGTFVFTVQEETGLRGAAAFLGNNPFEYSIALDTTTANDLPSVKKHQMVCQLHFGAVISLADGATIYRRSLVTSLFEYLTKMQIPHQTKSKRTGGNEASAMQKAGLGSQAISISVPCRYIHGPVGCVCVDDIEKSYFALFYSYHFFKKKEGSKC